MKSYLNSFGEIPEKKQEILEFWRRTGFLQGLKEGGIMEWRCAKSFNNVALRVLECEEDIAPFDSILFPIVRRLITVGKHKVHRILEYDDIVDILKVYTIKELLDFIQPSYPKNAWRLFMGITNYFTAPDPADRLNSEKSLMDKTIWECYLNKNNYMINQNLFSYYACCDLEAEIVAMTCTYIQHIFKFGAVHAHEAIGKKN